MHTTPHHQRLMSHIVLQVTKRGQGRQVPFTTQDAVVPVLPRVHVAFAGFALAGEQFAMQTVPTAVLVHAEGQVPLPVMLPVRPVRAVVHTANTKRAAAGRHVVSAQQTFFAHSCSPRVVASLDNCH